MIKKRLKMPLFQSNFELVISDYDDNLANHLNYPQSELGNPFASVFNWEAHDNSSQMIYVVFNKKWEGQITLGVIAHESSHAISYAFHRKGINTDPNSETFCYSIEWLVDEIYKFLNKNNFKLK